MWSPMTSTPVTVNSHFSYWNLSSATPSKILHRLLNSTAPVPRLLHTSRSRLQNEWYWVSWEGASKKGGVENSAIFLPARRYASAGNSDRNVSVRPSVRLSVTRRYCVKTKKVIGIISSPSGSPKTLVFWRQISSPNSKGFPPNGGLKQGSVGKIQRFFSFKRQYLENCSRYGQSYY